MKEYTLAELSVFLGVVGGIITGLLLTIQKSKCKKIDLCCLSCERDPTLKTDEAEKIAPPKPSVLRPQSASPTRLGRP